MTRLTLATLLAATLTVGAALSACHDASTADPSTVEQPAPAGTLVDWEHLGRTMVPGHLDKQADIFRFSYITESDRRQIVTGRLAVPAEQFQTYDMVAHLHGTIGFADHCAPSRMPGFGFETPVNPMPADMVAAGRIVVMPDYPGLGAPGRHRYIERDATGRSVWDGLVAGRTLAEIVRPAGAVTNRVLLVGHSQGAHATLASLATKRPEDDFDVVGAVAFAPPGDAVQHARLVAEGEARAAPLAWGLWSWSNAYPDHLQMEDWVQPRVASHLPRLMEERCAPSVTVWLGPWAEDIYTPEALETFASGELPEGLRHVLERERVDDLHTDTEIVIFHGTRDGLLPAELSQQLAERLAENGNAVEWHSVDGAGHLGVPRRARAEALAWVAKRF